MGRRRAQLAARPTSHGDITATRADVIIDNHRLETLFIAGDTARATIVLLHEGLGSLDLWRDLPQQLAVASRRSVLAYSRYGYGNSDPFAEPREPGYMHHEAGVVLPALLAHFATVHPILMGHSDGASIALIAAGNGSTDPTALVLIAPHVFVEELSLRSIAATRVQYQTTDLRTKLARRHADVDATFFGWNDVWLDPRFRDWNIEQSIDGIRCPVLLVQGEDDEYGTIAQIDAICKRKSASTVIVPRAAHSPHRDAPEVVLAAIVDFVDGLER